MRLKFWKPKEPLKPWESDIKGLWWFFFSGLPVIGPVVTKMWTISLKLQGK